MKTKTRQAAKKPKSPRTTRTKTPTARPARPARPARDRWQWFWWSDPAAARDDHSCLFKADRTLIAAASPYDAVPVTDFYGGTSECFKRELTPLGKVLDKHAKRLGVMQTWLLQNHCRTDNNRLTLREMATQFNTTVPRLRRHVAQAVTRLTWLARGGLTGQDTLRDMLADELVRIGRTWRHARIRVRLDPRAMSQPQGFTPPTAAVVGLALGDAGTLVLKLRHPEVAEITLDEIQGGQD